MWINTVGESDVMKWYRPGGVGGSPCKMMYVRGLSRQDVVNRIVMTPAHLRCSCRGNKLPWITTALANPVLSLVPTVRSNMPLDCRHMCAASCVPFVLRANFKNSGSVIRRLRPTHVSYCWYEEELIKSDAIFFRHVAVFQRRNYFCRNPTLSPRNIRSSRKEV
jgi:hypothetical protein